MKAFVTGGTGFIGSYLLKALLDQGCEILALRRKESNLSRIKPFAEKIKWVMTEDDWQTVAANYRPDIIYHLAWQGVSAADRISYACQTDNIALLQSVLDIADRSDVSKIVSTGSQSEYGAFTQKVDETYPLHPNTAYAACKVAASYILRTYCEGKGIKWYWLRLFPCFGPGESERWLIPSLIKSICTKQSMDFTPGEQKLAYLYVGEVSQALAAIAHKNAPSGAYNVSADHPMPLREMVTLIRNKINPNFKLNFGALPYRPGQCMYMEGDTTALRREIYSLRTDNFAERMAQTIDYYTNKFKQQ